MEKMIVVWHDCDECVTKSLINYLNWIYLTKHSGTKINVFYRDDLKKTGMELTSTLKECEALIYSCHLYHDLEASKEEWKVVKNKQWYAVSWDTKKYEEYPLGLSLFSLNNLKFVDRESLVKLMEDIKRKRSRL